MLKDLSLTLNSSCIGHNVKIGKNVKIKESIIMNNVVIEDDVEIIKSLVCSRVKVGAGRRIVKDKIEFDEHLDSELKLQEVEQSTPKKKS